MTTTNIRSMGAWWQRSWNPGSHFSVFHCSSPVVLPFEPCMPFGEVCLNWWCSSGCFSIGGERKPFRICYLLHSPTAHVQLAILFPFLNFSLHKNLLAQNIPNALPKHNCYSLNSLLWPCRSPELDTLLSFGPCGNLNTNANPQAHNLKQILEPYLQLHPCCPQGSLQPESLLPHIAASM